MDTASLLRNLNRHLLLLAIWLAFCPEKGLHILVDAFRIVAETLGADNVQLHVAGYLGKKDEPYLEELVKQIQAWGLSDSFVHYGEVTRSQKIDFLNRLHVFQSPLFTVNLRGYPS